MEDFKPPLNFSRLTKDDRLKIADDTLSGSSSTTCSHSIAAQGKLLYAFTVKRFSQNDPESQ
jgi:hypothetical protein